MAKSLLQRWFGKSAPAQDASSADAETLLQHARAHRAAGRADDAEKQYRLAAQAAPEDEAVALELCTLQVERRRFSDALEVVSKALARLPRSANLHFFLGNLQQELGQADAALAAWRASLAENPDQVAVLHNMGNSLLARGDVEEAAVVLRRAARLAPDWADGQTNLGQLEIRQGNLDAAIGHFEKAAALDPASTHALGNLGEALLIKGDAASAQQAFERALAISPDMPAARLHLARLQLSREAFEDARLNFRKAAEQQPSNIEALFGVGEALLAEALRGDPAQRRARLDEAEAAFRAALAVDPACVQAEINLGVIHIEREEFEPAAALFGNILPQEAHAAMAHHSLGLIAEAHAKRAPPSQREAGYDTAIAHYRTAFAIDGRRIESLVSSASLYQEQLRFEEAAALYEQALAIAPGYPHATMNLGMLQLARGDFANGWRNHEARWHALPGLKRLDTSAPHWDGSAELQGRTILLYTEQGLGDNLQFIRFAPLLAARGATVWVRAPAPLKLLFASCPGVARVFGEYDDIPLPDLVCPLLSIPTALGTDLAGIPAAVPYLQASSERIAHWRGKLGPQTGLRVGLVWAGNPSKESRGGADMDRMRSLHVEQLRPILAVPDVEFHSLQVGKEQSAQRDPHSPLIDHTAALTDFQETAALAANLDLAICVDTSTAHLVGAIGKPVWLLNRYNTCWRWLLERQDSPWYPTMRIFRQPRFGDWEPVIACVAAALEAEVRSGRHQA